MTSLIKNQILKHLTKFFKDLAPEQLQLSAFKGSCELSNLQLDEKVLMELISFPAWININKAACDQLSIKIPWTKIKSVPIQMNLNEVMVEMEVCDEFRDILSSEDEVNISNLINTQSQGKYGFVDRVIDGITVTVNNVLITFKSKLMVATFNLSRVILESRCPNWKPGELSLTRIKDVNRSQILLFKIVEWQTMRLEAKCLTDPQQAPLRLITNHAQCRLTIKKKLDDCSVVAARIFVIFEDILWVLTFAQFTSAASFVEYIFTLIKRSPMSKKTGLLDEQANTPLSSSGPPLISPLNTPSQADKTPILTGNMSSASLLEQKFRCYDLIETSLHLFIDKVDAHLYDDTEISVNSTGKDSGRESGGALQTTLDQIQVDCYPYSRANSDRKHWYRWFDPSPNSRRQWLNSHFDEFDLMRQQKLQEAYQATRVEESEQITDSVSKPEVPIATDEHLLSLTVLVKIKDYCMNCVATSHSARGAGLNKFIQTDKDYHMPSEMPSFYLELNYFYYFDTINRMMIYDNVPDPLAFVHLSPTKLLFDSPTLVFLNSFQVNLSKAFVHLNDLFPDDTTAPKVHCRVEILMPQISLPAKSNNNNDSDSANRQQPHSIPTSALLVKSGKVTLSNSIYDRNILSKLTDSIDKLKENPSQPINFSGQSNNSKRDCTGDWTKVWNASLINKMSEFNVQNQLWTIQFEPVWMDFMNYDVDDLASGQRLEPIVEPVNAYTFIHLNLSSVASNSKTGAISIPGGQLETPDSSFCTTAPPTTKKRDVISILVTVMDGSILANMDKVQFSFLQRLGMHVEKLLQQIRADASTVVQLDTIVEDSLEINLTAYIKEIKARLILDKKIYADQGGDHAESSTKGVARFKPVALGKDEKPSLSISPLGPTGVYYKMKPSALSNPFEDKIKEEAGFLGVVYTPSETLAKSEVQPGIIDEDLLDECAEVADEASFLCLGDSNSVQSLPVPVSNAPKEENLLINLDEMEQSASLFAKVDLKSQQAAPEMQQQHQQEIETESISYLELSMGQLMVRRITETKRRQKF